MAKHQQSQAKRDELRFSHRFWPGFDRPRGVPGSPGQLVQTKQVPLLYSCNREDVEKCLILSGETLDKVGWQGQSRALDVGKGLHTESCGAHFPIKAPAGMTPGTNSGLRCVHRGERSTGWHQLGEQNGFGRCCFLPEFLMYEEAVRSQVRANHYLG